MNHTISTEVSTSTPALLGKRLPFPTNLAFEPVQLCNAACFCCPYTWLKDDDSYRGKTMSRAQIESLLRDFSSCRVKYGYEGKLRINPFRYSDPLVCKDLEFILGLCRELNIQCAITTNAVSFTDKNVEILDHYYDILGKVSISVIGSSTEEVLKLMNVNLERTFRLLSKAVQTAPRLRKKIRVNLRKLSGTSDEVERLESLSIRFEQILKRRPYIRETSWLSSRVDTVSITFPGDSRSPYQDQFRVKQTAERYVVSCPKNVLDRIEVMCDGDVVLCCDDAEKGKTFGNAFEEGIERIWNGALLNEHRLLFRPDYVTEKGDLICTTCSRAGWSDGSGPDASGDDF